MARNATSKMKIVLELEIDPQDEKTLSLAAGESSLASYLKACAEAYFHEFANGGLLLSGQEVDSISKTAKVEVSSSEQVVDLVEKSQKTQRGQKTVQISIDPALTESFQQMADFKGMTQDEFIQDCWSYIHANGWLYQMMPDVSWVPLGPKEISEIKKSTKAEVVTSKDVVDFVRKATA